jgi:integrase
VLVSPDSATSEQVTQQCALGRHFHRKLIPVLIRHVDALPWYLKDLQFEDFTVDAATALSQLMTSLPAPETHLTLGFARDAYLQRATLKSEHTISSYRRAIELFIEFIGERPLRRITSILPIQQQTFVTPEEIPLSALTEDDAPLFLHFAQWLLSPASGKSGDKRPYKPSTVELRLAGVQNWFQFLDDYGWLPGSFKLAKATRIVRDELRGRPQRSGPPQPPDHIEEVIYFYDNLELPARLRKPNVDPQRIQRWELTQQRNRALLRALAETGGRISEILSLNLDDFPPRNLAQQEVLRVEVVGKGGHPYYLRFFDTLPAIHAYIQARGTNLRATARGDVPLFVSHDPRYDGNRMGRVVAWRVAQRAARALGLRGITPHDFRHWRATQLINAGHSLDVVQEYLGHRSVETTRAYYAHTDPLRVDDAARNTPLPERDNDAD